MTTTTTQEFTPASQREKGRKIPYLRLGIIALLIVIAIVAPLYLPPFANYQLSMVAVAAVAILGINVIMGYTGQVSLGQTFFLGTGAYVSAYGVTQEWPIVLTFLLACIIPAALGFLIALAAARLRGLALAMVTLSLPIVAIPLAKRLSEFTGGATGKPVYFMSAPEGIGLEDDQWRYYIVGAIAVVLFLIIRNLVRGRFGRAFAIVRDNESVALSMGISPYRYKVLAFTIASALGGASGFLTLAVVQYVSPETLSFTASIHLVAALVIGGSASILGAIIGGFYYVFVPQLAGQINASYAALISGAVLLVVLFVLPGGLASAPRVWRRWREKRSGNGHSDLSPGQDSRVADSPHAAEEK